MPRKCNSNLGEAIDSGLTRYLADVAATDAVCKRKADAFQAQAGLVGDPHAVRGLGSPACDPYPSAGQRGVGALPLLPETFKCVDM
jgi:hypothetical protein